VGVRGYNPHVLENRRLIVEGLFNPVDNERRRQSLEEILELNHPVALILEMPRHSALQEWLAENGQNLRLFDDGNMAVWVIEPLRNRLASELNIPQLGSYFTSRPPYGAK
jgi:hypothetical protein